LLLDVLLFVSHSLRNKRSKSSLKSDHHVLVQRARFDTCGEVDGQTREAKDFRELTLELAREDQHLWEQLYNLAREYIHRKTCDMASVQRSGQRGLDNELSSHGGLPLDQPPHGNPECPDQILDSEYTAEWERGCSVLNARHTPASLIPGSIKIFLLCESLESLFLYASAFASREVQQYTPDCQVRLEEVNFSQWEKTRLPENVESWSDVMRVSPEFETPCNICGDTGAGAAQTLFLCVSEVPSDAFKLFAGYRKGCKCIDEYLFCFHCKARSKCVNLASLISSLQYHVTPSGEHRPFSDYSEERR
jgi:hypothetical protein